jgi:hypothetical protein
VISNGSIRFSFLTLPLLNSRGDKQGVLVVLEENDPELVDIHKDYKRRGFLYMGVYSLLFVGLVSGFKLYLVGSFSDRLYGRQLHTVATQLPGMIFRFAKTSGDDFSSPIAAKRSVYCLHSLPTV